MPFDTTILEVKVFSHMGYSNKLPVCVLSLTSLIIDFLQQHSEGSFKKMYQFMILTYLKLPSVVLRIKIQTPMEAVRDLSFAFFSILIPFTSLLPVLSVTLNFVLQIYINSILL